MTRPAVYDPKPADTVFTLLVERILPPAARPYARLMRLDRPIGWWLLLLPCWWSSALASIAASTAPNIRHFILFLIGAVVMRGAGSTWNDIVDRDLDASVERTRMRPIPSGAVSVRQASLFMVALLLTGFAILLTFNTFTIVIGLAAMLPVVIYPFIKRISNHPQIVLGLAFAWGGLIGWGAIRDELAAPAYLLYAAAIVWTIGYDTIYALQDIEDDPAVGIGSTALAYGDMVPVFVATMYIATVLLVGVAISLVAPNGIFAWAGLTGFALHLTWQVVTIRLKDPAWSLMQFKSNRDAGLILTAGLAAQAMANVLWG
jgi:4-hydroxybenzoate polyprenyltransferase